MRLVCPACERIAEVGSARQVGGRIEISCPGCGEVVGLDLGGAGEPARPSALGADGPAEAPTASCPRCGRARDGGSACPSCGLVFERWRGGATSPEESRLARLWDELEARWDDRELHGRFVEACLAAGALGFAAGRYRSRDDELSRRQVERLTALAFAALRASESSARPDPRLGRTVGWVLLLLVFVGLVGLLVVFHWHR